jgi:glutathione S-transferase
VLTENVAIRTYLARLFRQAKFLPEEPFGIARCLSHMTYLSSTLHPALTHIVRPGRFRDRRIGAGQLGIPGNCCRSSTGC